MQLAGTHHPSRVVPQGDQRHIDRRQQGRDLLLGDVRVQLPAPQPTVGGLLAQPRPPLASSHEPEVNRLVAELCGGIGQRVELMPHPRVPLVEHRQGGCRVAGVGRKRTGRGREESGGFPVGNNRDGER